MSSDAFPASSSDIPSPAPPSSHASSPRASRTGTARRRTQQERRESSERRLLAAALRLIGEKGAACTSLAEVGIAAGYSRGLPVERFGSKQGLLIAVMDLIETAFDRQVARDVDGKTGLAAVLARMESHLSSAIRSPEGIRALYMLYMESLTVAPFLRPRIAALGQRYREALAAHLREARATGEIRGDIDLDQQGAIILGALRGLITQWLIDPTSLDVDEAGAALAQTVRRGLEPAVRPATAESAPVLDRRR